MEFAFQKIYNSLPDLAIEIILAFEPNSRWHEEQRKPHDLTVWHKYSVRREIEHGNCKLIRRTIPRSPPKMTFPVFGSPRLKPTKTVASDIIPRLEDVNTEA
jgi:hypothetical protein